MQFHTRGFVQLPFTAEVAVCPNKFSLLNNNRTRKIKVVNFLSVINKAIKSYRLRVEEFQILQCNSADYESGLKVSKVI
jgi:hypothetical protein